MSGEESKYRLGGSAWWSARARTIGHEVLVRLAGGASNAEIAGGLFVGEATVKTHVSRVLMKIGLRDRTRAVVFAYENGVVRPGV